MSDQVKTLEQVSEWLEDAERGAWGFTPPLAAIRAVLEENKRLRGALEKIEGSTPGPGIDASSVAKAALGR